MAFRKRRHRGPCALEVTNLNAVASNLPRTCSKSQSLPNSVIFITELHLHVFLALCSSSNSEPDGRLQRCEVPDRLWITKITYLIVGTNTSENTTKNLTIHRPESVFNQTASSFPSSQGSIYWGERRGSFPPSNVSASPPKVLLKKNYNYFK